MADEQSLTDFIDEMAGDSYLRVQDDLGQGFVRLRAAEAQRRQAKQDIRTFEDVVIELLRNSRDAGAHAIFVATWADATRRHLTVLDDGSGIPPELTETVFEPFVTSKLDSFHADRWGVHGRGMALYSIRQNVDDAHIVASGLGMGSVFSIDTALDRPGEKRDQSSAPTVSADAHGALVLRGPHNITRTVMEFSIDERSRIAVYLGSCAEIVATLHHLGADAATRLSSIFGSWSDDTPFVQRFAFADDADELAELACSLGLPISSRTARRILNGEIAPLPLHLETLVPAHKEEGTEPAKKAATPRRRSTRIDEADLGRLAEATLEAYRPLASAYYLSASVEPTARVQGCELVVRVPLEPLE